VEVIIKGEPKEIAALVLAVQERMENAYSVVLERSNSHANDLIVKHDEITKIIASAIASNKNGIT